MQAFEEAFGGLIEALQWFVDADEVRLLHVQAEPQLFEQTVQRVVAQENDPSNTCPFLLLQAPFEGKQDWRAFADAVRTEYEDFRDSVSQGPDAISMPPLPKQVSSTIALSGLGLALQSLADVLVDPFSGWTIVVAPLSVEDKERWSRDLASLVSQPLLARLRWIVVEGSTTGSRATLTDTVGASAVETADVRVSEEAMGAQLSAMVQGLRNAEPSAQGFAAVGMPGPRQSPPPRAGSTNPVVAEVGEVDELAEGTSEGVEQALVDAGVSPGVLDLAGMRQLNLHVLVAAEHASEGRFVEAVREQKLALDQSVALNLGRESLVMEHVLGCYVMQSGAHARARSVFEQMRDKAERVGEPEQAVQAQLSIGASFLAEQRYQDAAVAYTKAGAQGERLEQPLLAIEGYRLAGQYALQEKQEAHAVKVWKSALSLADGLPPEDRLDGSSAAEVASALADLCEQRGLDAQAKSLRGQAASLGQPPAFGANNEAQEQTR